MAIPFFNNHHLNIFNIRRSLTLLVISIVLCSCNNMAMDNTEDSNQQVDTNGSWFTRAPLPTARQEMPLTLFDGKIYVPGGFDGEGSGSSLVEVFDPSSNTWSTIPNLPTPLNHLAMVGLNDKLYVIGGYLGSSFVSHNNVYEYNFQTENWNLKSPMFTSRGAHVSVVYDGKIYAIGGANGSGVLSVNEVYDPASDSWTILQPMPTSQDHLAAAVLDSLIYVVGGRNSQFVNQRSLHAYSPASDSWSTLADMPTARGGLAAAAMNGKLYVFGGEFFIPGGSSGVFKENEEYDPVTNTWRSVTPLTTPRHGMSAVTVADTIFVIGGGPVAGFGVTDVNQGFTFAPGAN